jgi:hypothetical protein
MTPTRQVFSFVCAFVLGLIPAVARGTVYYVDASSSGGDGLSWANAFDDLQDALTVAQDGDEIRAAQGVYKPHASNVNVSFVLVDEVVHIGGFAGLAGNDPDEWDPDVYVTILSGDLADDDGDECAQCHNLCENKNDNSRHVVDASAVGDVQ